MTQTTAGSQTSSLPTKPRSLQRAEHAVSRLRAERRAVEDRLTIEGAMMRNAGRSVPSKEYRAIESELAEVDDQLRAARGELDSERRKFQPEFLGHAVPVCERAAEQIAGLLDQLEAALAPVSQMLRFAELNALDAPRLAAIEPSVRSLVSELRRSIVKQRAGIARKP